MRKKRSLCPLACALDVLGDRWTLLIVRDLFAGKSYYREFLNSPEGIATNISADRLKCLESNGIIEKYGKDARSVKSAYRLTPRGKALLPILSAAANWGLQHIEGTRQYIQVKPDG